MAGSGITFEDAGEHEAAGDEANLALQVPALPAPGNVPAGLLPGLDATVEDPEVVAAGGGKGAAGLLGPLAAATDHDGVVREQRCDRFDLGPQLVEGAHGVQSGGRAHPLGIDCTGTQHRNDKSAARSVLIRRVDAESRPARSAEALGRAAERA